MPRITVQDAAAIPPLVIAVWGLLVGLRNIYRKWRKRKEEERSRLENIEKTVQQLVGAMEAHNRRMDQQAVMFEVTEAIKGERFKLLLDGADFALWEADATGRIAVVNQAFCALFDRQPSDLIGDGWQSLVDVSDQETVSSRWAASVKNVTAATCEFRVGGRRRRRCGRRLQGPRWKPPPMGWDAEGNRCTDWSLTFLHC